VDEQKRLGVWEKIREFQAQLGSIDEEQVILNREKAQIAGLEEEARVEEFATSRNVLREDGIAVANKLTSELMTVAGLFNQLCELGERDRIAKDILRSLAPHRTTETPDFWSYEGSTVDPAFKVSLAQTISELHRWNRELQRRAKTNGDVP